MPNLNRVMLMGAVNGNASLTLPNGEPTLTFVLTLIEKWNATDGKPRTRMDHVECYMRGKRAIALAPYVTDGKPVYVEGKVRHEPHVTADSGTRFYVAVEVSNLEFLGAAPRERTVAGTGGAA